MNETQFQKELEQLINKHSIENDSNTPDFIIAQYVMNCLQTLNILTKRREDWYGRTPKEMEGIGFKDVKDCSINKNIQPTVSFKGHSGLESIIKYCSNMTGKLQYPYYFFFSLATNYYDDSSNGTVKDPSYARLWVGRYLKSGKKLESPIYFGPIKSIINNRALYHLNTDTPNVIETLEIKKVIDTHLQKEHNVPLEEFMFIPPMDTNHLDIETQKV